MKVESRMTHHKHEREKKGERILRDGCLKRALGELAWANASERLVSDAEASAFQNDAIPKLLVKLFSMIEKAQAIRDRHAFD